MRDTAEFLDKRLTCDKKVILTGPMPPSDGFSTSDAALNLGYLIASFNYLEPGVYLSMNGGVFQATEVSKNVELFRFEKQIAL